MQIPKVPKTFEVANLNYMNQHLIKGNLDIYMNILLKGINYLLLLLLTVFHIYYMP